MKRFNLKILLSGIFVLATVIVIIIEFVPTVRIPMDWSVECSDKVNGLIVQISMAYIGAFVFYILTDVLRFNIMREGQKFMRYDALRDLKCLIQDTFDQVYPEKRGVYSKEDLKSEISDSYGGVRNEVQNQLCEGSCEILRTIRTLLTCAIVWDDEELNIFNMCYNICTGIVDNADLHNPAGLSDLVLTMIDIGENIGKIQNNIMNK